MQFEICQHGDCTSGANVLIGQKRYCERHALYILSEQEKAAQQNVQRTASGAGWVARLGHFIIRKGWWLVGYGSR
jgi:hypothetical protein